ncbi:TRAP transporter large permease subunit [Corynebacterium flavescens]|uniref:TRAP transporter large permease subunit n=1 Tax=Corynebacterium flavescens TaxID=28028 RepID=UPI002649F1B9|nr:TRAP transporter large permease subunit [Corynebacterium flavescens]MDN6099649.1 TRAP transporter permease [Corynebacterium flavescens]MDN6227268.1 TRAP transporter permease [Corynebacterium flavescens]MDN6431592.1 TRAP transporter permease [Corynebacterium flavescens]MDN6474862.1 TRAP transporter permease [Corynebacterium flavescens]MDN6530965.1 TRAP transporter permease [Corynebacterium flavescens]
MGIAALLVFIAVTVVFNTFVKRDISESLVIALIATALMGGTQAPALLGNAMFEAAQSEVTFAGMAFVFMGIIVQATGLIDRLIEILNSLFGRLRGGAAYVSTLGSAMIGLIAGSTAGNSATVGSVTIPWMKKSGWSSTRAATLVAGNSGLGVALPPNSTMFIILALPAAAGASASSVYVALACGGAYAVLYRLAVVFWWTRKDQIEASSSDEIKTFRESMREGWRSPSIFMGIVIPVILTIGPVAGYLTKELGTDAVKSISIIVWVPVLITLIALLEGAKHIRRNNAQFRAQLKRDSSQFATVGISLFAALSAAKIMEELGVGDQLSGILDALDLPRWIMLIAVAILAVLVATPLSSTATAAAIGAPAVAALTAVGLDPAAAIVVILLCTSTEGASPPVGAPIYLSAAMAEADPPKMFVPLIVYFVLPLMLLAWLIGMGWLPIYVPA